MSILSPVSAPNLTLTLTSCNRLSAMPYLSPPEARKASTTITAGETRGRKGTLLSTADVNPIACVGTQSHINLYLLQQIISDVLSIPTGSLEGFNNNNRGWNPWQRGYSTLYGRCQSYRLCR